MYSIKDDFSVFHIGEKIDLPFIYSLPDDLEEEDVAQFIEQMEAWITSRPFYFRHPNDNELIIAEGTVDAIINGRAFITIEKVSKNNKVELKPLGRKRK